MAPNAKRVCVDIGGAFTNCLVLDETTGQFTLVKSPMTPSDPSDGFLNAMAHVTEFLRRIGLDVIHPYGFS